MAEQEETTREYTRGEMREATRNNYNAGWNAAMRAVERAAITTALTGGTMPVATTPDTYLAPDPDAVERIQHMAAEARGWELVQALANALAGLPHWRRDGQRLLREISEGIVPEPSGRRDGSN